MDETSNEINRSSNHMDETSNEINTETSHSDSCGFFNKKTEISDDNSELSTNYTTSYNKTSSNVWKNHSNESTSSAHHIGQFGPYNPMKNWKKKTKLLGDNKVNLGRKFKENQRESVKETVMMEKKEKEELFVMKTKRKGKKKEEMMAVEKRRESLNYFFPESQTISMDWVTLYIQMQLCQITLKQWLSCSTFETPCPLYDSQVGYIFKQIVQGLDYIHSQGIVHHDIKPSNIFVSHDLKSVQVGDFGLACCLSPTPS
ncbi:hypothetical protein WDU94_008848 [Cyamophila willieti]